MSVLDHSLDIVDQVTFRNGVSRLGTSVSVVITQADGKRYGFTASAVCSVSDTPGTLLVCINRASSSFPAFENARHFCVNTLMPGQEGICAAICMAEPLVPKSFNSCPWTTRRSSASRVDEFLPKTDSTERLTKSLGSFGNVGLSGGYRCNWDRC